MFLLSDTTLLWWALEIVFLWKATASSCLNTDSFWFSALSGLSVLHLICLIMHGLINNAYPTAVRAFVEGSHNSPIYDECQTQSALVLALPWKRAQHDDSNVSFKLISLGIELSHFYSYATRVLGQITSEAFPLQNGGVPSKIDESLVAEVKRVWPLRRCPRMSRRPKGHWPRVSAETRLSLWCDGPGVSPVVIPG